MRTIPVALALILALLALPAAVPQADESPTHEDHEALPREPHALGHDTTGRFHGTGLAHGTNESLGFITANITQNWTLVNGQAIVAIVVSDTYRLVCHDGIALVSHQNGSLAQHECTMLHGIESPRVNVIVPGQDSVPLLDTHVQIDQDNSTIYSRGADNEPPNPWPGIIVTVLAVLLAAAATLLAWAYGSERRISRYLVRRLFEETRGRVPKEWPEHLKRRVIARFVVGGKN